MESVRQKVRPKHQVLILKCFPRYQKGVLDVKPNGSELSYLLYYASTRRSKLQKVGAFLEKKAARDVSRRRIGNVQVILQILSALVEKLPRELPLYGHSVLNVLEIVLRSHDIAMVEETLQTFETFCSHQDLAVLAAEQRYATQLEGYKEYVSSEGLNADGGKQLACIVPVILENVYDGGEELLDSLHRTAQNNEKSVPEQIRRRRASTVTVQTVDTTDGNVAEASGTTADADKAAELEVRLLAIKCLEQIFVVSSNRPQIRTAAGLVLNFIVDKDGDHKSETAPQDYGKWANSLMDIITKWCPVQDRFIVLFTAVEILRGISADGQPVDQQIVMASLIDSLLKSPVNMIGLSVIDVLVGFVQHILRLLQAPSPSSQPSQGDSAIRRDSNTNDTTQQETTITGEHVKLVSLLKQCIADLATHNYYADQISDMVLTLLRRIRPLAPPDITAGTLSKIISEPNASTNNISILTGERQAENYFYSTVSRIVALEAVKDILGVANQRKTTTGPEIESRNRVGLQVWEGTHWLLRESDRHVRNAYADAFISWLELETTKIDLKVVDSNNRLSRAQSKREHEGYKRNTSSAAVDKTYTHASSVFLQLLHLSLYETAVEYADNQEDILVAYIVLVQMVEKLGVNAVRFGLPMVLKLQSESFATVTSQVHIGSLVYGYLAALTERFTFSSSRLGSAISAEISRRQKNNAWLEMVQYPPLPMNQIPSSATGSLSRPDLQEPLRPFTAVEDLVKHIEEAYNAALAAPQSPPGSPGKHVASQSTGYGYFNSAQTPATLPVDVKEDMLSTWSKEASIAVLEQEKARASSVAGSRNGTSARRSYVSHYPNGYISNDGGSPTSLNRNNQNTTGPVPGSSSSSQGYRYSGNQAADGASGISSRDSTIRVNDLKRMLTVTGNSNVRRSSPLRGRLDASNSSVLTSSSESFLSGTFSASDFDLESRPQSVREGSETPKAASAPITSSYSSTNVSNYDNNSIPPVPPLPSGLVIPGGFPDTSSTDLSRQSSSRSDGRSSVISPGQIKPGGSIKGKSNGSTVNRSLSGKRTRSTTSLHKAASLRQQQQEGSAGAGTENSSVRLDIEKLLDGVLPRDNSTTTTTLSFVDQNGGTRRTSGGIGRPPY
ncbi:conserved hypothetical protein [Talaromyces stipitatus ATCC 10500]|uniref:Protein EFR3 n=1 Tax=Talaromyces stipitatus (strain ATCC 10500 / CBS 375.48 / QM 6759 / NRRL 1006) TaxID=441959 RepID=B8M825_TALSN|nr:uncharacterized protein TSTA_032430 [Talaromyces stipitatus ATCC 10500]EED19987.1 conserved hypothetical protein [Talaromyces stipitatus ATCC 10500]